MHRAVNRPGSLNQLPDQQHPRHATGIDPGFARNPRHAFAQTLRLRRFGMALQIRLAPDEDREPGNHADAGRTEAVFPAIGFTEKRADQTGAQGADIDARVEQREARIAARIIRVIQPADDGADVGLEKAHAHDDRSALP